MLKFQWLWGFLWGSRVSWLGLGLGRGKGVKALGLLGRAWVSSLPKFFLGKYFHFWKLPPLFCIKSSDNVYYPIFLLKNGFHFFIWKMVENGIKCAFPGRRTYVLSVDNFSGKARERVFSLYLSTSPSIYPQHNILIYPQAHQTSPQPQRQYHTSSLAIFP